MFRATVTDDLDMDSLIRSMETNTRDALNAGMDEVAAVAQVDHVYQNRTGTLSASTTAIAASGTFLGDSLEAGVEVTAVYAGWVMDRTGDEFLERAMTATVDQIARRIEEGIDAALPSR